MRLYLSSFRVGDHPDRLAALVGRGARTAVITNACDAYPAAERQAGVERELASLRGIGLEPQELDLREFFGRPNLGDELRDVALVWVRGGNTFLLRHALAASGADTILIRLLRADAVVYGGYSAGVCVLGPTLRGLEFADDPSAVTRIYGASPRWDGLGLVPFAVAPHYRSPGHPETAMAERLAKYYEAQAIAHHKLRDGQVILIEADKTEVLPAASA